MAFNNGKPYHGSSAVSRGKLSGRTGRSDYFFFLCPTCSNGQILRILDYKFREPSNPKGRAEEKKPRQYFNLAFHLYCPECQFEDFTKLDNNHRADRLESHPKFPTSQLRVATNAGEK